MTQAPVASIAIIGAAGAALLGVALPWWTVMIAEVAVTAWARWATHALHREELDELRGEVDAITSATEATRLLFWVAESHPGGRWSMVWARGLPLVAWRDEPRYIASARDRGPCSYWLDTWPDPVGRHDELSAALTAGSTHWVSRSGGRVYETEAIPAGGGRIVCHTLDVTEIEREGAQRGRADMLAIAAAIDEASGPARAGAQVVADG